LLRFIFSNFFISWLQMHNKHRSGRGTKNSPDLKTVEHRESTRSAALRGLPPPEEKSATAKSRSAKIATSMTPPASNLVDLAIYMLQSRDPPLSRYRSSRRRGRDLADPQRASGPTRSFQEITPLVLYDRGERSRN
jgi:hypothetical protein